MQASDLSDGSNHSSLEDQREETIQQEQYALPPPRPLSMRRRQLTFEAGFPRDCPVRPTELANAGFFFTGQDDIVECTYCHERIQGWLPGDDAMQEHRTHFPDCPFIISRPVMESDDASSHTGARNVVRGAVGGVSAPIAMPSDNLMRYLMPNDRRMRETYLVDTTRIAQPQEPLSPSIRSQLTEMGFDSDQVNSAAQILTARGEAITINDMINHMPNTRLTLGNDGGAAGEVNYMPNDTENAQLSADAGISFGIEESLQVGGYSEQHIQDLQEQVRILEQTIDEKDEALALSESQKASMLERITQLRNQLKETREDWKRMEMHVVAEYQCELAYKDSRITELEERVNELEDRIGTQL